MIRIKRSVLVKLFMWLAVYPAIPAVIVSIGMIVYANWPRDFKNFELPVIHPDTEQVVFIAHGKDDDASTWAVELQQAYRALSQDTTQVFTLDWTPYSDNFLRCSVDGRYIGRSLARQLVAQTKVKKLHLIGHSAGAFVAYGLCEGAKQKNNSIQIQTTYLDPLGVYGALFWDFAQDRFGDCANFSEAYIDVESGVPGSNEPLVNPHTFNVTSVRSGRGFNGSAHIWPVHYYKSLLDNGSAP
ncbi:MAG: hypothetical protein OER96_13525, partial [Gammaproteobacteria bacterium]|nr:hypothetical protein [Gammaproteobacteria bacterium]